MCPLFRTIPVEAEGHCARQGIEARWLPKVAKSISISGRGDPVGREALCKSRRLQAPSHFDRLSARRRPLAERAEGICKAPEVPLAERR